MGGKPLKPTRAGRRTPDVIPKVCLSWSSGKDSAFALWRIQQRGEFEVASLMTTVTKEFERVSMHGVRDSLLLRQAEAANLPLRKVWIPTPCSNEAYEQAMSMAVEWLLKE